MLTCRQQNTLEQTQLATNGVTGITSRVESGIVPLTSKEEATVGRLFVRTGSNPVTFSPQLYGIVGIGSVAGDVRCPAGPCKASDMWGKIGPSF